MKKQTLSKLKNNVHSDKLLLNELRNLIESTKESIVYAANSELVLLHWKIGERLQNEIIKNTRADYGEMIVSTLSGQLQVEFGNGFSRSSLFKMIQFYKAYPEVETISILSRQLNWSHFVELLSIRNDLERSFYSELCRIERWSVRALRKKIKGMLYQRTAISKKPEKVVKQELEKLRKEDIITPNLILKDPYLLEFLELKDTYSEKDLEEAILKEIEKFILELGSSFAFIARQKRISIGEDDYFIDLLFYNRALRRLIVVELKIGKFQASDKGQMELYLRWLDKHERKSGEESPLGIILCTNKNHEQVELLELAQTGIHIAEFITELPSAEVLEKKLHKAIQYVKARLEKNF